MSAFGVGFRTLLLKETRRFLRVPGQTVAAPVVTTLLYFLVFGYSIGSQLRTVHGVPYMRFIVPGLVIMPLISNAFLNTASSMFIAKVQGTIVDLLVAPLSYGEVLAAFVLAAVARSLIVGAMVYVVAGLFTGFAIAHPAWVLVFALVTAAGFSVAGLVVAIVTDKFEQLNIIPTFVITPLSFLGGVFYSLDFLPPLWRAVSRANPILYMVDGLRYGFIGTSDVGPWVGLAILLAMVTVGGGVAYGILRSGYKLRG
jgi:ABC-2 type transport system permease protein